MKLDSHLRGALKALAMVEGEAVIEKRGRIFAQGEHLPFGSVTYLRLLTRGLVEAAGPDRIRITAGGREPVTP